LAVEQMRQEALGAARPTGNVYDEGCALVEAYVRAAFWGKAPDWIGTDPPTWNGPTSRSASPPTATFN
jgi:hypothetical protein